MGGGGKGGASVRSGGSSSGYSGGGGSSGSSTATTAGPFVGIERVELQPFMNGFDETIAQQLSYGYGGNPQDYLTDLHNIYSPMSVPVFPLPEKK
ncbi:hypothetical protein [Roseibium album]|uniref:hypothetical protein n=1 Tax=Roseibium album TaxID=311410 RepID=UPI003BB1CD5B